MGTGARPDLPDSFAATWLAQAHKERVTDDGKIMVRIVMRSARQAFLPASLARPYAWSLSRRFRSLITRRTSVRGSASATAAAGKVGLGLRGSRTPTPGGRDGRPLRSRSRSH